jgi:hypothetical protein
VVFRVVAERRRRLAQGAGCPAQPLNHPEATVGIQRLSGHTKMVVDGTSHFAPSAALGAPAPCRRVPVGVQALACSNPATIQFPTGVRGNASPESRARPQISWTAVAERSGDTAFARTLRHQVPPTSARTKAPWRFCQTYLFKFARTERKPKGKNHNVRNFDGTIQPRMELTLRCAPVNSILWWLGHTRIITFWAT